MKNITKFALCVLAVTSFLAAGNAMAGHPKGDRGWHKGPPSPEKQLAHITEALDLTDQQSAEMLAILQDAEDAREALHEQTMAIMGEQICAQKAQTEEAILTVLDAEQAETFLQMKSDRQARASEGRGRHRGGPDCSEYEEGD